MPNPENHIRTEAIITGGQDVDGAVWDGVAPAPKKDQKKSVPYKRRTFRRYLRGLHRELYSNLFSPDLE